MGESVRLGSGRCPVCGSIKARFTLSAKGLAVITCNACNFQGFARSEHSDEKLRALISHEPTAAPAPAADPPAPGAPGAPTPAPSPAPDPQPEPATTGGRRSFMSW